LANWPKYQGNSPTKVTFAEELTPKTLGSLVALYEHNVFTQGAISKMDSCDVWGVELGKVLARQIIPELKNHDNPELTYDGSSPLRQYRQSLGREIITGCTKAASITN
jgi:glucose-6-phosphate isomerase